MPKVIELTTEGQRLKEFALLLVRYLPASLEVVRGCGLDLADYPVEYWSIRVVASGIMGHFKKEVGYIQFASKVQCTDREWKDALVSAAMRLETENPGKSVQIISTN